MNDDEQPLDMNSESWLYLFFIEEECLYKYDAVWTYSGLVADEIIEKLQRGSDDSNPH